MNIHQCKQYNNLKKKMEIINNYILSKLCIVIICIRKNQTEKYWSNVLDDLLKIAEFCFPSLSIEICYEVKKLSYF